MEASKITLTHETKKQMYNEMPVKKRRELRRKAIIDYIDSQPAGTPISAKTFQAVGGFYSDANAHAFLIKMIRDGLIKKVPIESSNKVSWVTKTGMKIIKEAAKAKEVSVPPVPMTMPIVPFGESRVHLATAINPNELEKAARQYSWQNQEQNNDLRAFVQWMKESYRG